MSLSQTEDKQADRLLGLSETILDEPGFAEVLASLKAGHGATLGGIWGSSCALTAAALASEAPATLVIVAPRPDDVDKLIDDLRLFSAARIEPFAAWESTGAERKVDDQIHGDRLHVLKLLAAQGGQSPFCSARSEE